MPADDAAKFDAFLADYRAHGNGSIAISVPSGAGMQQAVITASANADQRHGHQPRPDPGRDP